MFINKLVRRVRVTFAILPILALGLLLLHPQLASAEGFKGRVPAHGHAPARTLQVHMYSADGVAFTPQARVWTRTPTVGRRRDPMWTRIQGAHRGDKILLERQGRSKSLDVGHLKGVNSYESLLATAEKLLTWKGVPTKDGNGFQPIVINPNVDNSDNHHVDTQTQRNRVWWPKTVVKVTAKDRNGRDLGEQRLTVEGLPALNTAEVNLVNTTPNIQNYQQHGRHLPSARAWINTNNVLVSEPTQNRSLVKEGEGLVASGKRSLSRAKRKDTLLKGLQTRIAKGVAGFSNYKNPQEAYNKARQKVAQLPNEIRELTTEGNRQLQEGEKKINDGKEVRVIVAAIGAGPNGANFQTINPELTNTQQKHTAAGQLSVQNGSLISDLAGSRGQVLRTTVTIPAGTNNVGSTLTIDHTVPNGKTAQFVKEIDGIKFYRMSPL
ncbi:MAG: hypothetical protein KC503_32970, partial [Myxococcales bacterium]|nr:hypothetical protein [Myxococcales bacterium]